MVLGTIGTILSDLFFLEITSIILLNSQALLSNGHAKLSLPIFFFLLLPLLSLNTHFTLIRPHKLISPSHYVLILLKDVPQHNEITMDAPHLLFWSACTVHLCFLCMKVALQGDQSYLLDFIHQLQNQRRSMSTIHLKKKDTAVKGLENGSEIQVLYQEFQTLKSQIYGVKREPKPKVMESHWSSKGNKDKAVEKLRESTIQKCQQEFQENLSLIQTSQHKFKKNLFKRSSQVPDATLNDDRLVDIGESPMPSQSYSRKLKEYDQSPSINLEESAKVSIAQDHLCFTEGEQLFRDFLNRMQRPIFPQLSASRRTQMDYSLSLSTIKDMLTSIAQDHLKKLNFLFQTLTFMSRKLHCLEMIIQEYGKILKTKLESLQKNQEQQLIINVESLQTKYSTQLQKLTQFYQQQLRKQSSKRSIEQSRASSDSITESLKMENIRLGQLLNQARCLISTKEELITALSEENQELREEVDKWKRPNLIRGSAESSLGYSATADKHTKKDGSSHQMELIAERLNLALGPGREDKRGWDDFEEGSQDDINYSELESVRDKSMDEWDISHLQVRQTSNAKSLQQDCLKIMRDKQGEVSQEDI